LMVQGKLALKHSSSHLRQLDMIRCITNLICLTA
jgi:hypothetical protein